MTSRHVTWPCSVQVMLELQQQLCVAPSHCGTVESFPPSLLPHPFPSSLLPFFPPSHLSFLLIVVMWLTGTSHVHWWLLSGERTAVIWSTLYSHRHQPARSRLAGRQLLVAINEHLLIFYRVHSATNERLQTRSKRVAVSRPTALWRWGWINWHLIVSEMQTNLSQQ